MKRRKFRWEIVSLAMVLALQSPMAVLAADMEEEILYAGTAEMVEEYAEEFYIGTGTEEAPEEGAVCGAADIAENEELLCGQAENSFMGVSVYEAALEQAMHYLRSKVTSPVVDSIGGEWAVMAMARYGVLNDAVKNEYLKNLYQTLRETDGVLSTSKYTEYSRVIMALASMGMSAEEVGGYRVLDALANRKNLRKQGINGPIFALIALDTRNYEVPELSGDGEQTTRDGLIQEILDSQNEGGWSLIGGSPESDMTAMALQALAPYRNREDVKAAVNQGIETLAEMQEADGGYGGSAFTGSDRNLESSAQVVIALSAIDVSLINSSDFMKNGKTLLDEIMSFQLENGAFEHVRGGGENGMASEQGALALTAWYRAANGQTSLYDMTDMGGNSGGEEDVGESEENVKKFREKMAHLPTKLTLQEKDEVYALQVELEQMKAFAEKDKFANQLKDSIRELERQEQEVNALDDRIWTELDPLNITLSDKKTIEALYDAYQKLPGANRAFAKNSGELLRAVTIIEKLQDGIIAREVFENVKNSKKDYIYQGNGYQIRLKGKSVYKPADMKAGITVSQNSDSTAFSMKASGNLPGEVELSVDSRLKDGIYMLYQGSDEKPVQWTGVSEGILVCDVSTGGNYLLKKAEEPKETPTPTPTPKAAPSPANKNSSSGSSGSTGSTGSAGGRGASSGNGSTAAPAASNTVKAQVKDGIVEKSAFEEVKGKDKNLKIEGETVKNQPYTLTMNGKDITEPKDFKSGVKLGGNYEEDIRKLAENPFIFHFEEAGKFPGKLQAELMTGLDDGEYLLLKFNTGERKAQLIQKVTVKDKKTKFIIEEGGDYFIAKKVKTQSVTELENRKASAAAEAEQELADGIPMEEEEVFLPGTMEKETKPVFLYILLIAAGVLAAAGAAGLYWHYRKKAD